MHFSVLPLRCKLAACRHSRLPSFTNRFRGAFGAALRQAGCPADCAGSGELCSYGLGCTYATFFDPRWPAGPSGYRHAPRPFVFRWSAPHSYLDLFLFESKPPVEQIENALASAALKVTGREPMHLDLRTPLCLPLLGPDHSGSLHLRFATPTDLKSRGHSVLEPCFPTLIERLAERVYALGRRYQSWPAEMSFTHLLERAHQVRLLDYEWTHSATPRRSARSGQVHSVGGFTGWAEYTGPIGSLLPLLNIGRWTGVGRQTVWGNGAIFIDAELKKIAL